jgi:hypothetical protein
MTLQLECLVLLRQPPWVANHRGKKNMSRKGHYNGGGTILNRANMSWFGEPKGPAKVRKRRLPLTEIAFNEHQVKITEPRTELLKSDDARAKRKVWKRRKTSRSP